MALFVFLGLFTLETASGYKSSMLDHGGSLVAIFGFSISEYVKTFGSTNLSKIEQFIQIMFR
jgi:hypothetical protein